MRLGLKRSITFLAIYSIALRIILLGIAPVGPVEAATVDPLAFICHGAAQTPADQAPGKPDLVPGHACEHCNLCNAVAPPSAPDVALAATMAPVRVLHVLRPASAAARPSITSDPKLARGPPQPV
jgi:hypothetical protein